MAKEYAKEILSQLSEDWFLSEPAFFAIYCQQQLEENTRMDCPVRCGCGRLEYNPLILNHKNYDEIDQLIRIELIRLYLKHPYERRPEGCCNEAISIGSNITIADGYCVLHKEKLPLHDPAYYHLPLGQYYEWYAKHIQQQSDDKNQDQKDNSNNQTQQNQPNEGNHSSHDNPGNEHAQLWQDNSLERQKINELIERTTDWGSIPSNVVESIKASTNARIDQRLIWQGFHSAIISCQRNLTRMKPNRRSGFLQMGSIRQFDTHLLIAIDVSGSIDDKMLADFYSSINRVFRYGNINMDICMFDAEMGHVTHLKKAKIEIEVIGRGGTNFQPVIDYFQDHTEQYDGMIIFTDGNAPEPSINRKHLAPILWVTPDRLSYEQRKDMLKKTGRVTHL